VTVTESTLPVQFQSQPDAPLQFAGKLPEKADVVVIGAGIIGVCTAYYLAGAGLNVVLCEKGRVACEQSSRNWGWIRQLGRDNDELPIMMESTRLWENLSREIGEDVGFRQHGIIYLASSEKKLAARESWMATAAAHNLDTQMITAASVEQQISGIPGRWCGGIYTPNDGRAEPFIAVPAIARAAQRRGVSIREHCAVRDIERQNGRVSGVVTEHGVVQCDAVVLAGGAWSSLFATRLGLTLPQLTVRSTVVATSAVPSVYKGNAADEKLAFRRRQDGGYTLALSDLTEHFVGPDSFRYLKLFVPAFLDDWRSFTFGLPPKSWPDGWKTSRAWSADEVSPFELNRILNPQPGKGVAQTLINRFKERFPALTDVTVAHSWAGMIDTMPDVVPVIDHVPECSGLTIATGFSGHGFGIGPAAGKLTAELVQGNAVAYNMKRFRYKRFQDGSKIVLGPTL
jgi:glycine/D-amino acid oxidase-like deaminating enzyme